MQSGEPPPRKPRNPVAGPLAAKTPSRGNTPLEQGRRAGAMRLAPVGNRRGGVWGEGMLQLYVVYVPCARGTYMYHGGAEFFVAPLYMDYMENSCGRQKIAARNESAAVAQARR